MDLLRRERLQAAPVSQRSTGLISVSRAFQALAVLVGEVQHWTILHTASAPRTVVRPVHGAPVIADHACATGASHVPLRVAEGLAARTAPGDVQVLRRAALRRQRVEFH